MSEISFICLSLDLDAGKVGIGGIEGPSAPGRKQVSELSMFVCVSDVTPRLRSWRMFCNVISSCLRCHFFFSH